MNKPNTSYVIVKDMVEDFRNGKIFLDKTQRTPSFVDGIIKKHLYYAVKNISHRSFTTKELDVFANFNIEVIDESWHGETAIIYVSKNNKLACTDGGHRHYSFLSFVDGKDICTFNYEGSSDIKKFYEKLAKKMGKSLSDSFSFAELPKEYQEAFLGLKLFCYIDFSNAKNATGEAFMDANQQKNQTTQNKINATFADDAFYQVYSETAKCIAKFNLKKGLDKKSTPSWYNKAKKSTQDAYIEVCKGLRYTRKSYDSIFKLLLRCTNCAEWEGGASTVVHFGICDTYKNVSKNTAIDLIMNTISNMAYATTLLDYKYLEGINVWTAIVNVFGVPVPTSHIKTKSPSTRTPLPMSGRFLKNRKLFNNLFNACVTGFKTTFNGTNFAINAGAGSSVFNHNMLRESPTVRGNMEMISKVFVAIYNEVKEEK